MNMKAYNLNFVCT